MDYSKFLRYLHEHIDASGRGGRHVIRFPNQASYADCIHELKWSRRNSSALRQIRASSILNALFCPLQPHFLTDFRRFGLSVEKDSRIGMYSTASALAGVRERHQDLPWGVRRIGAPEAWSMSTGNQVRIGVIDTGVDYKHPDLQHCLARGMNVINQMSLPFDDNGHGTHIAGTISAASRAKGMRGVAPGAIIYPIKAFDHNGSAYVSDIILGIDWCVRNRMHIINMSFGMKGKSQSLQSIIRKAHAAGVIVVASSGNDKRAKSADYPARYSNTISVGATNRDGNIASFSNHGNYIDIYAPGEKINSCWLGGGYREMNGTSMATSHVSGAIALLLAVHPDLKPNEIKKRLRRTSRPLHGSSSSKARIAPGSGEVHAVRLLRDRHLSQP